MALLRSPTIFATDVLGILPWSKQVEIRQAVAEHRRVAIQSGHGCGKTLTLAWLIIEWMLSNPNARVRCTASTNKQVHSILWAEVQKLYASARFEMPGVMLDKEWRISPSWRAEAISCDDPTAMQGLHSPATLIVVDESEGVHHSMRAAIESLMSSSGSRLVESYNPVTPSGHCYEISRRPDLYKLIQISCLDHPNVISGENVIPGGISREWVEEVRSREGEDSPFWQSRVLGRFPKSSTNSLITIDEIDAACGPTGVEDVARIGVDVARFGDDKTVLVVLDKTRRVVEEIEWWHQDTMRTTGAIIDAMTRHEVDPYCVAIDSSNAGGPIVDRLHEQGYPVIPVDFGSGPKGDWSDVVGRHIQFQNRKAELHWVARSLIRAKQFWIPVEYKRMRSDLVAPTYHFSSNGGKVIIESKDEVKVRLKRSPDNGDAAIIALGSLGSQRPCIQ